MSDVELVLEGRDATGRTARIASPTWTAMPADAVTPTMPGHFTLNREGEVTFRGCTGEGSSALCASVRLLVDDGPPTLMITAPSPGQELGGDGARDFEVRGAVTDGRMRTVFVNGQRVAVGADGAFSTRVAALFGNNHVEVVASDGVQPEVRRELDVLFAESYEPAAAMGRPAVQTADALGLRLGRRFFDDGTAPTSTMRPLRTDDLADVVWLVLRSLDRSVLPPNPLVNASGLTLSVTGLTVPAAQVDLRVVEGGLELFVRATDVELQTTGSFSATGSTLSLDGGVVATLAAYMRIDIARAASGATQTTVRQFSLALENTRGRFASSEANALFAVLTGALRTRVESTITAAVEPTLRSSIPTAIGSIFSALDGALAMRTLPIDTPPLPSFSLSLDGGLDSLRFDPLRSVHAGLSLSSETNVPMARFATARGVPVSTASAMPAPFLLEPRAQLGVRLAALNGVLHTLWNSGLLELDLGPVLPMNLRGLVMNPRISAKLPPVVRTARPGERSRLTLSLGQLEFEGVSMSVTSRFGVSIDAGLDVTFRDNRLAIAIAEEPAVRVWVISETPARRSTLLNTDLLRSTLVRTVWPQLRMSLASTLAFDIPVPPIDALAAVAPSLRGFRVALSASEMIAERDGYLVFDADLHGELP